MPHQSSIPNVANRTLFEADNLPVMRGINSETIDLIATDPPFNKGKDFHATPDSLAAGAKFQDRWKWEDDVHPDWVETIQDQWPAVWAVIDWTRMAYGDDMGAFLCFIGVRLMEMHRILKPAGSLYLHCDPTASHYLKALMDAIFGRKNFRNEVIWRRTKGRSDAQRFGRVHEVLLFYVKDAEQATWNQQLGDHDPEYVKRTYRNEDERGRWRSDQLTASDRRGGESGKPWRGVDPDAKGNHWRTPTQGGMNDYIREHNLIPGWPDAYPSVHARLDALDAAGLIHWPKKPGGMPCLKRYLASTKGVAIDSIWDDISRLEAASAEKTGYPTQKPLALYDRIIRASSNEGDWVLDPFAGCATTPIAAELANRNWIAIDLWDGAIKTTIERFQKTTGLAADGTAVNTMAIIGQLQHRTDPPERTDDGDPAAPYLPTPAKGQRRPRLMTEHQIKDLLVAHLGLHCWGCNFFAPDPRYLELDHIRPRNSGGSDDIDNRALLCGPCNKIKRDHATLVSLRKANEHAGHLAGIHPVNLKEAGRWTRRVYEDALAARLSP